MTSLPFISKWFSWREMKGFLTLSDINERRASDARSDSGVVSGSFPSFVLSCQTVHIRLILMYMQIDVVCGQI